MIEPTRVVVKVLPVTPDKKVLILRRSKTDVRRPLEWDIAGGAADDGETTSQTAVRETIEETGISLEEGQLRLSYAHAAQTEKGNVVWLFYVCHVTEELKVVLSDEHDEYKWVHIDEAQELITYDRQQVAIKHINTHVLAS